MQYQSTKHVAVIVAGLGGLENFPTLTSSWAKYGIETVHFKPMWKSAESFENKLGRFLGFIDLLVSQGKTVSLVGTSAGGSMVVNAFIERKVWLFDCGATGGNQIVITNLIPGNPVLDGTSIGRLPPTQLPQSRGWSPHNSTSPSKMPR
ncbi:MAG: hypothetical protein UU06_C0029G0001 [Parcubacteria group bacterium GW2011_GWB1_40_5]|nr:MAG: hypothetical protein UU06_C0029G0001 [Parcubacteria group bacterium GW2011_GWB1_40_5]